MNPQTPPLPTKKPENDDRKKRSITDYEYVDSNDNSIDLGDEAGNEGGVGMDYPNEPTEGLMPNSSEFYYRRARLFPNVKGCG